MVKSAGTLTTVLPAAYMFAFAGNLGTQKRQTEICLLIYEINNLFLFEE